MTHTNIFVQARVMQDFWKLEVLRPSPKVLFQFQAGIIPDLVIQLECHIQSMMVLLYQLLQEGIDQTRLDQTRIYQTNQLTDYAIKELGFAESEIVLYGWSIGGFSVVYGASYYKNLKGIYLDATFDDVMPLGNTSALIL